MENASPKTVSERDVREAVALGYTQQEYAVFKKNAIKVLLLFAFLYCFLYCGRLNMAAALTPMGEQMGWDTAALGILSSVLFWTYGFGHLFNGRLGEIFGIKRFIVAGTLLSVAANVLISFQASIVVIAILWGFNGYFQSMLWSPGMALISKWWPGNRRGFATGFCNAFSSVGNFVSWVTVAIAFAIAPQMGWRAAFVFPMIFMVIMVAVFAIFTKEKPSDFGLAEYKENKARADHEEELKKIVEEKGKIYPYVHLFKQWRFDCWLLIVSGSNLARYGLLTWIPMYFVQSMGLEVKAGIIGSLLLPLGMALGTFIVPWATDKFCPHNRLPAVILCSLVAAATVFIFPRLTTISSAAALLFFAGFFIYAINGTVWAYATDIGGRVFGGTATGILDWAAYMGAAVQAMFFGFTLRGGNWNFLFLCIAGVCLAITVLALIAGAGQKKKLKAE